MGWGAVKQMSDVGVQETRRLGKVQNKSRRAQVLDALRDAILDGDLKPGDPLREVELAAEFNISRAPLREALQILSAEGLIEIVPYHGTTVRRLTKVDIEELYSLRITLETFAIERVITLNEPDTLPQLRAIYERMVRAAETNDFHSVTEVDREFHQCLIALSRHSMLQSVWNTVAMRVRQVMTLRNKRNSSPMQIALNHLPIIDAIAAKDVERAAGEIKVHIASAGDLLREEWELKDAANAKAEKADDPNSGIGDTGNGANGI
jgi:DNA-binding GntR family transcriptional regulator